MSARTVDTDQNNYLTPSEAAELARQTVGRLAQMRYLGTGPTYLKPTPRTVLYRRADVLEWLEASECKTTHAA